MHFTCSKIKISLNPTMKRVPRLWHVPIKRFVLIEINFIVKVTTFCLHLHKHLVLLKLPTQTTYCYHNHIVSVDWLENSNAEFIFRYSSSCSILLMI